MQELPHRHPIYQGKFNQDLKCLNCSKNGNNSDNYYYCEFCSIGLCQNCYNKLCSVPNDKHVHKLSIGRTTFKCDKCKISFRYSITMCCRKCDFDLCPNCYCSKS